MHGGMRAHILIAVMSIVIYTEVENHMTGQVLQVTKLVTLQDSTK